MTATYVEPLSRATGSRSGRTAVLRRCGGRQCPPGTCDHDGELRRDAYGPGPATAPRAVHDVLHRSGDALDAGARGYLEPRFGYDFSQVRVHTGPAAAASADAVAARAYTVGQDIVFAGGAYTPGTTEGRRLIAHELTHVVQQRRGVAARSPLRRQGGGGAAAATGRRFTAEGVTVDVRSSCAAEGFGLDTVEEATRDALDKIFNGDCIAPDRARQIQKNLTAHGLDFRCRRSAAIEGACAESTGFSIPANIITLGSKSFPDHPDVRPGCLPLASTILHEIIHITRGVEGEALPRSCEASCYGVGDAAPDLCKSPIVVPAAPGGAGAPPKDADATPPGKGGGGITVGEPDDEAEHEADRTAAKVMEMSA